MKQGRYFYLLSFAGIALSVVFLLLLIDKSHDRKGIHKNSFGFDPGALPGRPIDKDFLDYELVDKLRGFSGFNYSKNDFSQLSHDFLADQTFDTQTIWPSSNKLPSFFKPDQWIKNGKNPGLNVDELHKLNLKGEGLSVAVIDKPINPDHVEFTGRIHYIDVFHDVNQSRRHFHGIACASILAGNSCGILPKANLFYFAVPDNGRNSINYLVALEKLFEINDTLPAAKKIRAVSISDQIDTHIPEVAHKLPAILEKARERKIALFYSTSIPKSFLWGGCPPDKDPNQADNYMINPHFKGSDYYKGKIVIPADYRSTAGNDNNESYTHWGSTNTGFSWAIPYLTGIMVLGWSIDPDLTQYDLYDILIRTKTKTPNNWFCINPKGFINEIKSRKHIK